ncbi:MAG: DivIVA domain-containing protein [Propionibacteriaceae bacterium]|jgi:DivIVA domain-containing protein|nr:DivIVA domain-containing protein [Propionibacteriaceae bacterium]
MEWFIAVVAVVAIGFAAVAASGRLGELGEVKTDRPEPRWPDEPLAAADIDRLGFAVVPRGYAMDQVDEFCDRVKARLEELERRIGVGQEGDRLGAEPQRPGIMVPEEFSDQVEVMTTHGSDEA